MVLAPLVLAYDIKMCTWDFLSSWSFVSLCILYFYHFMYFMLCFQKVFNRTKHEKMESLFHSTVGNEITFLPFVCLAIVCLCRFLCIFLFYVSAVFQKSVYYCLLFLSDFSFSFCHSFSPLNSPEGRPGMSDVSPPVWNQRTVI